jgi:hypothetical protein
MRRIAADRSKTVAQVAINYVMCKVKAAPSSVKILACALMHGSVQMMQ